MWTREELKSRAKLTLGSTYWKSFLVSLVLVFAGGSDRGGVNLGGMGRFTFDDNRIELIGIILFLILIAIALGMAFRWFLGYPLEVGSRKYFVAQALGDVNLNYLGAAFRRDGYLNVVMTMFYRGVLLLLWTLLFIIPGIVKGYAYRMVPYILADNPRIGARRAIELSEQMTWGHKQEMFLLDLSFIGWYLLGAMACGIGVMFVRPYEDATNAELYLTLRSNALEKKLCTPEELSLNWSQDFNYTHS